MNGQPVGPNAKKLSISCGEVARMGNFFSILDDNWKRVPETSKEEAWEYLNEHYNLPESLRDYVLESINGCWRGHKTRIRRILDEQIKCTSYESIRALPPEDVERSQWKEFVRRYFDPKEKWADKKIQGQNTRSKLKEVHTCGRTSFAQKKKELEDKNGGPITPVALYQTVHTKKDKTMSEYSKAIVEKCREVIADKTSLGHKSTTAMEEEILREVRGPEHSGRVRGVGRGVTMTTLKIARMHEARVASETQKQRGEIDNLKREMEEKDEAIKSMQEQLLEKDGAFKAMQQQLLEQKQQIQVLMEIQGLQGASKRRRR